MARQRRLTLGLVGGDACTEAEAKQRLTFTDKLAASGGITGSVPRGEASSGGLNLSEVPALGAVYLLLE